MQQNLTQGSIWGNIRKFSLPYLLSYFMQALYGLADMFIIGMFNGADVITAVSAGSQVMHMIITMTVGFALASTVLISRAVGANDQKRISEIIGNSISLFFGISLVLTVLLLILTNPIVRLFQTPAEAVTQTAIYLRICFIGIPFIVAYNVIAAFFRGLGDSKSPMYFIAIACAANIGLDFLFVGPLGLKAAGAALGTILAQALSVIISIIVMFRRKRGIKLSVSDFKLKRRIINLLIKIGLPTSVQEGCIQVSFIVITIIANTRGVEIAAAVGIVEKIITFLFLVPSTMMSTTSALAAQNFGAGQPKRSSHTMFACMSIGAGAGLLAFALCNIVPGTIVGLFTSDPHVIELGIQYLRPYSLDCFIAAVHFCFSGYFIASGKSYLSFIHNIISIIVMRIPGAWIASVRWPQTLFPMGCAAPLGSFISVVICAVFYLALRRKLEKVYTKD